MNLNRIKLLNKPHENIPFWTKTSIIVSVVVYLLGISFFKISNSRGFVISTMSVIAFPIIINRSLLNYRDDNRKQKSLENEIFSKSTEQLSSNLSFTRLGGIYSLKELIHSSKNQETINKSLQILHSFIKDNSTIINQKLNNIDYLKEALEVYPSGNPYEISSPSDAKTEITKTFREIEELKTESYVSNFVEIIKIIANAYDKEIISKESRYKDYLNLSNCYLVGAKLQGINLSEAELSNINLQESNLNKTSFVNSTLDRANLRKALLLKTNLKESNLQGADLTNTFYLKTAIINNTKYSSGDNKHQKATKFPKDYNHSEFNWKSPMIFSMGEGMPNTAITVGLPTPEDFAK